MIIDFEEENNGVYKTVEDKNESELSSTISLDIDKYQPIKIVTSSKPGSSYDPINSRRNSQAGDT